ncbi:MAG: lipoate protein ligase C-terminal domain-containing protein, partial [Bacillota bacterium]|nr:lipoate protein ligase C-terminal domain-containing protein [Bacillota bacterium]
NGGYTFFLKPVIDALSNLGLHVELKGRNDLLLSGKKISGSAQSLSKNRILHHGTLLVHSDLDMIDKILNVSADKIQSKGIKSVRSRVTNIEDHVEGKLSVADVKEVLLKYWVEEKAGKKRFVPMQSELKEIEHIANHKYRSDNWTYGRSPRFSFRNKKRFSGGSLEVNLEVHEGKISECMLNGDFLSLKNVKDVETALIGIPYKKSQIKETMNMIPTELYFGDIGKQGLVDCFFE